MRPEIIRWVQQSEEDLITAQAAIASGRFYAGAFFCQQAAEKVLKALVMHQKKELLFTHDLLMLAQSLSAPSNILEAARELTPNYVITRYPNAANALPAELFNEGKASQHLNLAQEVFRWAQVQMEAKS